MLAGDFNVIPAARDVHNPAAWVNDALFRPATRESFQSLLGLGLTDALRAVTDAAGQYTFWDYQAGAWQKNHGIRIDHLLLSPQASDRLTGVGIDSYVRAWEKPSDHVPVWADLDLRGGLRRKPRRAHRLIGRRHFCHESHSVLAALHPVLEHLQRHRPVVVGGLGDRLVVAFLDPGSRPAWRCRAPASATSARARPDAAAARR